MRTFALTLVLVSVAALADEASGQIFGRVIDAETKEPIVDVVVTVTGPALGDQEYVVVTNNAGEYAVDVPPGTYLLRFEAGGYRPFERAGVQRTQGTSAMVRIELVHASIEELDTTRRCYFGPVDTTSSTVGETYAEEFIRRFPLR